MRIRSESALERLERAVVGTRARLIAADEHDELSVADRRRSIRGGRHHGRVDMTKKPEEDDRPPFDADAT